MNLERVEEIANAVLYEGYMLYPYRPSTVKNQQRWNFGVLFPSSYCELHSGSESYWMQTQCMVRARRDSRLTVRLRFLQIVQRRVAEMIATASSATNDLELVDRLEFEGRVYQPWQEATEHTVTFDGLELAASNSHERSCAIPGGASREELRDNEGNLAGALLREWKPLSGLIDVVSEPCQDGVIKLRVRVANRTAFDADQSSVRDAAILHSLVSAHVILGVENGEFISSLDPPREFEDAIRDCVNVGVWPVLAGDDASTMLASPVILYDYPQIAPESAGNLFDGTEIDEILSLRILTLTDQEKAEIRQSDDRAREALERTESIPQEQFLKLHGVLRGLTQYQEETK